ncbi:hypothetical protein X777_01453 [Ooceraea biroi]|uniref:Uncharacterized protein n=1 Tax=Ooceraea biroi TaxID=2015173 RepID=A0A026WPT7_OOCBI|nr:hypothetical protein X777_01453 [Ooceraea biroi]
MEQGIIERNYQECISKHRETFESRSETELQLPDWLLNTKAGVTPHGVATVRGRVSSSSTRFNACCPPTFTFARQHHVPTAV